MHGDDLIRRLAVALAIGLLVGAERHWRERDEAAGKRTAGVRTFALVGLSGGIVAALASPLGQLGAAVLLGAGLLALMAALIPFALREAQAENRYSATGLVAAVATYALGALAMSGDAEAAGALVAGVVSCLRTAVLAFLVAPDTAFLLWPALLAAAVAMGLVAAALMRRRTPASDPATPTGNPFEIGAVLRMALLLAGVGALAKFGSERLGEAAVIVIAAVTGLTDVDAITLSVPLLAPGTITTALAAQAVAVAVASNIVAKAVYGVTLGDARFGRIFGLGSAAGLAAGAAALFITAG